MKKLLLLLCAVLLLTSCGNTGSSDTSTEDTEEKKVISSADYVNFGKMGDVDGPAFAVYSKTGYSGASATIDLASMEINTVMDKKYINGYAFFGIAGNAIQIGHMQERSFSRHWHIFFK